MAPAQVSESPVVETVSRRRILSPKEAAQAQGNARPEFWEYIESLRPEDLSIHIIYIYREEPRATTYTGQMSCVDKCPGYIEMPNGTHVPFNDREEVEMAIREKFGGKAFRLIIKKGHERITEGKSVNDWPPRYPMTGASGAGPLPNANAADTSNATVATTAINAMASQQPDAIRLAMTVLESASRMVLSPPNQAQTASASDSRHDRLYDILLQRALEPPKQMSELDLLIKAKELFGSPAKSGVSETLELMGALKTAGLINIGGGKGGGLLELGASILPNVANAAVEGIREWRMGVEAHERTVRAAQGGGTVIQHQPQPQPNPPAALPAQPAQPAAVAQEAAVIDDAPPFQWIEKKIVEILKDPGYTIDQAVDETLAFLYRAHPAVVGMMLDPPKIDARLAPGEQGILQLFQHEPILKQIPVNPRLVEFIKKFIAAAQEAEQQRMQAAAAPANAPPAPAS